MDDVRIEQADPASPAARYAIGRYLAELEARFPGGFRPEDDTDDAAAAFRHPDGTFLVASRGDVTVACGALRLLDPETAEVKRMWVDPSARGAGLGSRLLRLLEDEARRLGCARVVLDTNGTLLEAMALYRRHGYSEVERYNDNPYAEHWFEARLDLTDTDGEA